MTNVQNASTNMTSVSNSSAMPNSLPNEGGQMSTSVVQSFPHPRQEVSPTLIHSQIYYCHNQQRTVRDTCQIEPHEPFDIGNRQQTQFTTFPISPATKTTLQNSSTETFNDLNANQVSEQRTPDMVSSREKQKCNAEQLQTKQLPISSCYTPMQNVSTVQALKPAPNIDLPPFPCGPSSEKTGGGEKEDLSNLKAPKSGDDDDDDLWCEICGRAFATWRLLKEDLVNHIREAGQQSRDDSSSDASSKTKRKTQKTTRSSKTRPKRGRLSRKKTLDDARTDVDSSPEDKNSAFDPSTEGGEEVLRSPAEPLREVRRRGRPSKKVQNKNNDDKVATKSVTTADVAEGVAGEAEATNSRTSPTKSGPTPRRAGQSVCRVCRTIFDDKEALRSHYTHAHNNGRPFHCTVCDKFFTTKNNLSVHQRHRHAQGGQDPCRCQVCGKKLSSRTNLKIHMMIHEGQKPFSCPLCAKRFSRKANMEMHLVYHTGERRFTCEVCGQSFFAINALKRHTKLHTGERAFVCDLCDASYVTRTDLRRHRLKHDPVKPFPCTLCPKQFTRAHDLKVHLRYHNKEIQFTCSVCDKAFVESGNYRRHLRRHTGERPYVCPFCRQTFSQVQHYKVHLRTQHEGESTDNWTTSGPPRNPPLTQRVPPISQNQSDPKPDQLPHDPRDRIPQHHIINQQHLGAPLLASSQHVTSQPLMTCHVTPSSGVPPNQGHTAPTQQNQPPTFIQYNSYIYNTAGVISPYTPVFDMQCHQ